jgi:hypothetical protein
LPGWKSQTENRKLASVNRPLITAAPKIANLRLGNVGNLGNLRQARSLSCWSLATAALLAACGLLLLLCRELKADYQRLPLSGHYPTDLSLGQECGKQFYFLARNYLYLQSLADEKIFL